MYCALIVLPTYLVIMPSSHALPWASVTPVLVLCCALQSVPKSELVAEELARLRRWLYCHWYSWLKWWGHAWLKWCLNSSITGCGTFCTYLVLACLGWVVVALPGSQSWHPSCCCCCQVSMGLLKIFWSRMAADKMAMLAPTMEKDDLQSSCLSPRSKGFEVITVEGVPQWRITV